jgi:FG-GAP repeat
LLHTITNPTPAAFDAFGASVAALGNDRVIIGATHDDLGATNAGTAYLFSIPSPPTPPSLTIQRTTTNTVVVSWPSPSTDYVLQQNANGLSSLNWSNVTAAIQDDGTNITFTAMPADGELYFRLFNSNSH